MDIMLPISLKYYAVFAVILVAGLSIFALILKILFFQTKDKSWLKYLLFILVPLIINFLFCKFLYYKINIVEKEFSEQNVKTEQCDTVPNKKNVTISLDAVISPTKDSNKK
jgi:uncharacterized membrane protein